jgi:hypothetical protein
MLPRVLLHVVKSPRPLNCPSNGPNWEIVVYDVQNLVAVVADIEDVSITQAPKIIRLSTRTRVKRRPVEHRFPGDKRPAPPKKRFCGRARHNTSVKRAQIGIVVIQAMRGHCSKVYHLAG